MLRIWAWSSCSTVAIGVVLCSHPARCGGTGRSPGPGVVLSTAQPAGRAGRPSARSPAGRAWPHRLRPASGDDGRASYNQLGTCPAAALAAVSAVDAWRLLGPAGTAVAKLGRNFGVR